MLDRMMPMRATLVLVLALAGTAHADEDDTKSPLAAGLISAGGTAVAIFGGGAALVSVNYTHSTAAKVSLVATSAVSWLTLPSLGHYYAGDWVSTGTVVRAVGLGLMGLAALGNDHDENNAPILPALGALTVLTGMAIDIATAPRAAREYNTQRRVAISPAIFPSASGPLVGVSVGGQF
jgi:hypothetical protein